MNDWIQTFKGKQFYPLAPRVEDIDIDDIAHALSNQCRFSGHCKRFYSVAEHSVRVSLIVKPKHRLWALLHDAAEAYLVDLPTPIKQLMPEYSIAEKRIMACVCEKFGLSLEMPKEVHQADMIMLATEKRDLMYQEPAPWQALPEPLKGKIGHPREEITRWEFLRAFEDACGVTA
jgi:5'-deoxynucleotidase YfbR-like HD superfamily hydrolase